MDQSKSGSKTVLAKLQEAGPAAGEISSAFEALGTANEKIVGLLLHGDAARALQVKVEESNPAFEKVMSAIGKTQQVLAREEETEVAIQTLPPAGYKPLSSPWSES